jgi:hypothetical protein
MMPQKPLKNGDNGENGHVIPFRPRALRPSKGKPRPRDFTRSPVPDLSKYSREPEEDDYRHRMRMNLFAFAALSLIVYCGIWIADNMSERTKVQDCILIGRTNCAPIPVPPPR